jgi:ATP-dependent Lon protease
MVETRSSKRKQQPVPKKSWVDDDSLFKDEEDSEYEPSVSSPPPKKRRKISETTIRLDIESESDYDFELSEEEYEPSDGTYDSQDDVESDEDDDDDDDEDEDDEELEIDEDLAIMLARTLGASYGRSSGPTIIEIPVKRKSDKSETEKTPIYLSKKEKAYFEKLSTNESATIVERMKGVERLLGETDIPLKFKVLNLNTSDETKAIIIRKIDTINNMGPESGEGQKLRLWVESALRIPFGTYVPLPVNITDGFDTCSSFLKETRSKLDKATYGMDSAKLQIMQIMGQWISNPNSVGNCIAMQGPAGVGKTSFAKNGIASALNRPFMFFSLGGASDISHYTGYSFTYEGSTWGRIVDSIINAKCMNPVLYFDELDKISGTPHGEEIVSMLIHLTDRSQNSQFHDRYFAGMDFDLSKCLFIFSYNDEKKISPILKDRMITIQCSGYNDKEKKIIIANYIWKEVLERAGISSGQLSASEEAADYIIKEYSNGEEGMRSMIRIVEAVVARINLLRMSDLETAQKYKFYLPVSLPMCLTVDNVKKLLSDCLPKEPETWRLMYM